jgi:hypothetical protein
MSAFQFRNRDSPGSTHQEYRSASLAEERQKIAGSMAQRKTLPYCSFIPSNRRHPHGQLFGKCRAFFCTLLDPLQQFLEPV